MELTHRNICIEASKFLRKHGIQPFHRCLYSVCELERIGECPDAFGWNYNTQLIEVKASRSDFLSDKRKRWRKNPEQGLGNFRSYMCPEGIIKVEDLPPYWGLLYIDENKNITVIKQPEYQKSAIGSEIHLITNIMRREGIKYQTFSYKNYK